MSNATRLVRERPSSIIVSSDGFVLVAMMVALSFGAIFFTLGLSHISAVQAPELRTATARVEHIAQGVREAYLRMGKFPRSITEVSPFLQVDVRGRWRVDPFGISQEIDYIHLTTAPERVTIRSRGIDAVLGTADDYTSTVEEQQLGRQRSRSRMRLVRAAAFASDYMTPHKAKQRDVDALHAQVTRFVGAQRELLHVKPKQRSALVATRQAAASEISRLRKRVKAKPWPKSLLGRKGLLKKLKLDALFERDGFGSLLVFDPSVAVLSSGGDRVGGTLDDF